ncbi:Transmembrane emp24 domain-containing protein p24delta7 [Linum perenne]
MVDPLDGDPKITVKVIYLFHSSPKLRLELFSSFFIGLRIIVLVQVNSPYGITYHVGENVEKGTFAFTASETGDYSACFWTPHHIPLLTNTVDFNWRSGVAAKDWSNIAKKGKVEAMELEIRKLYETVKGIHDEIYYLREREEEMQELNRTTTSNMLGMSLLFLAVCLAVAGIHLWHLKKYFERKKLL